MEYYLAPLEGITGHIFRNIYGKHFGGITKYFTPFIATNQNFTIQNRDKKDVLPENNQGIYLVPQVLSNNSEQFINMAEKLEALGYKEINLNLGCPSRTVVPKKKGAGFLAYPEELDRFLDEIYHGCKAVEISIKTRIGMEAPEEFYELLNIYGRYPLKELIIHPRLQTDYYKNDPNMELFEESLNLVKTDICYNGDLFTVQDIEDFRQRFPQVEKVMLGRGILKAPSLLQELRGEARDLGKWLEFLTELEEAYEKDFSGDRNVLFKMKELWFYLFQSLPEQEKSQKAMRKVKELADYKILVRLILG